VPLFFSMISCARRTSVRSISEADISCDLSRRFGLGMGLEVIFGMIRKRMADGQGEPEFQFANGIEAGRRDPGRAQS
jgi:hypothetical protein